MTEIMSRPGGNSRVGLEYDETLFARRGSWTVGELAGPPPGSESAKGKYANVGTSSDAFAARKREEVALEER